jgi:hypothetical protein
VKAAAQLEFSFEFPSRPPIGWRRLRLPRRGPLRCGVCAAKWPAFFDVPDIVWKHYVPPDERGQIVCIACWRKLVVVTDDGAYQRAHGGPLALGCEAWRKRRGVPKDAPLDWFAFVCGARAFWRGFRMIRRLGAAELEGGASAALREVDKLLDQGRVGVRRQALEDRS